MLKRRALLFAMLMVFPAPGNHLQAAEDVTPPSLSTSSSNLYPEVTCTTSDATASVDALQLARDTREQLSSLLGLGPHWRFPVRIRILTPDDPLANKIHQEGVAAVVADKTMELHGVVPVSDPNAREFIQRQYVTALLWEKFFPKDQVFDTTTRLDIVPLWLIEGLREWLNDDPEHVRENIVRRAVENQRVPSLAVIATWQDLSEDRLLGLWQRAFSYYLVNSLIPQGPKRVNFQQWLASVSGPNPQSAQFLFPTEAGWQRELLEATTRSRDVVYTWDQTAAELAKVETFDLAVPGASQVHTSTLEDVITLPRSKPLIEAVEQKNTVLTGLELRAHLSWRPILELYRFGFGAYVKDKDSQRAMQYLLQARLRRDEEVAYHQKLLDYINWFEVTRDYADTDSRFRAYFLAAQAMDQVQAENPNPIRASLIKVESQF